MDKANCINSIHVHSERILYVVPSCDRMVSPLMKRLTSNQHVLVSTLARDGGIGGVAFTMVHQIVSPVFDRSATKAFSSAINLQATNVSSPLWSTYAVNIHSVREAMACRDH